MEKQGLISVIIPVYNVEQYLCECVDSVLNQTWQNFEIILVDDGSRDGSSKICDEYAQKESRVKVIHQKNQGLSMARNNGFAASFGEYVYFLDSDDWIECNTLELLIAAANGVHAQMVFFDAVSFLDSGEICTRQSYRRSIQYEAGAGMAVLEHIQKNMDFHSAVPMLFMKRDFLLENNLAFYPGIVYEDMLFTFQVYCLAESVAHVNRPLYHRRYRSNSITSVKRSIKNFMSSKTVYEKAVEFVEQNKLQCNATNGHIVRCAFNAMNQYADLGREERQVCREHYLTLRKSLLKNNAFASKSLKARCYGRIPWAIVRSLEKIGS